MHRRTLIVGTLSLALAGTRPAGDVAAWGSKLATHYLKTRVIVQGEI